MASVGNSVQPSIDLHLKPLVLVRPLASVLWINANLFCLVSTVFKLPDELILSILSYISPDPRLSGHHARFRMPYSAGMSNCHIQRVEFLLPLSMTCRAMRLRLLPWVWELLEIPQRLVLASKKPTVRKLDTILSGPYTDTFLATNVRYSCTLLHPWIGADFVSFDKGW